MLGEAMEGRAVRGDAELGYMSHSLRTIVDIYLNMFRALDKLSIARR